MKKTSRLISFIIALSLMLSATGQLTFAENESETEPEISLFADNSDMQVYTCDFTTLVKDNADTMYGTATDVIKLNDYVTAHLTYTGTYVGADGKVYLTASGTGKGSHTRGSYIELTAITSGTAYFSGSTYNYSIDGTYKGYEGSGGAEKSIQLAKGQTLQLASRTATTFIKELRFETRGEVEEISSLKIRYENDGTLIKELNCSTENLAVGDNYTYISDNYITGDNGEIYLVGTDYTEDTSAPATINNNGESPLKKTVTLEADNILTFEVSKTQNIVFYNEWENILNTDSPSNIIGERYVASGGRWTATTKTVPFFEVKEDGNYQITLVGGPKKRGTAIYADEVTAQTAIKADDGIELLNLKSDTNSDTLGIYSVKTVSLHAGDNLTIRGFGSKNTSDNIDYVVVRRVYKNEISGADGISVLPDGVKEQYQFDGNAESIAWSVSGADGVTIDNNGLLTVAETAQAGEAVITVTADGTPYTKTVTIAKPQIADFTLSGAGIIELNGNARYRAVKVKDQFGKDITDNVQTSFASSNDSVIAIDETGMATSKADGKAAITVTASIGDSSKQKTVEVSTVIFTVTAQANGDSTTIDTSGIVKSSNISGLLVTTAKNGVLVKQSRVDAADSITVDTKNADIVEISPIFTYSAISNVKDGYTLADEIADGVYNITFTKADTGRADIYLNDYMLGNNVDVSGSSRSVTEGSVYKAVNVNVTGGRQTVRLDECGNNVTLSSVNIEKVPSIVNRKTKITVLGGTKEASVYGVRTNKDLGNNQSGWGERLYRYIDNTQYDVVNLAGSNENMKSNRDIFNSAVENSLKGDIILAVCGYDGTTTADELKEYMQEMSDIADSKEVNLIFMTPIIDFGSNENYNDEIGLGSAVKEKASELNTTVIDLTAVSYNYAKSLFGASFDSAKSAYNASLGISDGENLSFAGATKYAELIAKELRNKNIVNAFNLQYEYNTTYSGKTISASMNDADSFISYTAYKDETSAGVTILPDITGEVSVTLYSSDDTEIETKIIQMADKAQTVKFNSPSVNGAKIKITGGGKTSEFINVDAISRAQSDAMDNMKYGNAAIPYRYYLPQNYDSEKQYPIIMYLHGAGRRGSDNNDQLINGQYIVNSLLSEKYLNNTETECIIVNPQCPSSGKWVGVPAWSTGSYNYDDISAGESLKAAHDIIIDFTEKYSVDMNRIYIAGQSMGGYGTWRMAADYPELFAAAVPLCGGGPKDEKGAGKIAEANMPIWAFHGSSDSTVPVSGSRDMVTALNTFGATKVKYTELEGRNHEIQGEVFTTVAAEEGLYEWLFAQNKSGEVSYDREISDYEIGGARTVNVGNTEKLTLDKVSDQFGDNITELVSMTNFTSDNTSVVSVSDDGTMTGAGTGIANITLTLVMGEKNKTVTIPVKSAVYEIVSSDAQIDVSNFASYGTNTYRIYGADGYETVTAVNNKVENKTGGEVTVVPVYKLSFRKDGKDGYTKASGTYNMQTGYGLMNGVNYSLNENGAKPLENPLKVDLPNGRYDLDILRTGSRADVYSNGCQIINYQGQATQNRPTGTTLFNVPEVLVESGNLNLTFGNISSGGGERIAEVEIAKVPDKYHQPTIYVAGDSESANYLPCDSEGLDLENDKLMMTGFGMQLKYFMSDKYGISNMGQASATSKTWHDECFESVLYQLKEGDIFLMDFGINEVSSKTNKMTLDEMKTLMAYMADKVKAKGATPVLLSPVYCGKYQEQSYFTYNKATGKNDAEDFAKEIGIDFIDLNKYLTLYIDKATEETGDANWRNNNYQVTKDNLHITQYGALLTASFICGGLNALGYETNDFAFTYKDNSSVTSEYARGGETGVERIYSVAEAMKFMGLEKASGKVVPEYNSVSKMLTLTTDTALIKKAAVIKTTYNPDNTVKEIKVYDGVFNNKTAQIENIDITSSDKVFIWGSLNNMKPLADVFDLTK